MLGINGRLIFATWYALERFLTTSGFDANRLITHILPLEKFEDAFALLSGHEALKVIFEIGAFPMSAREEFARRSAQRSIDDLRKTGQYKALHTVSSPMGPVATIDGREVIVLCSNDYLGLANDPRVVEAGIEGLEDARRRHRLGPFHLRDVRRPR